MNEGQEARIAFSTCILYHCFAATVNMESEVKREQQETKIIRKNERYPHQHQQQKLESLNEHSFLHDSAKISSSEFSTSSSNLISASTEIANRKSGQHDSNNEANIMNILTMDAHSVTSMKNGDNRNDLHTLTNEQIHDPFKPNKMINGHSETRSDIENDEICASNTVQDVNVCESGFRIDHFAECLAEDVLEDSLLEAKAEMGNQEIIISGSNQIPEKIASTENNNLEAKEKYTNQTKDNNSSTSYSSCTETGFTDTVNSVNENPNPKTSDARVHSKSLCLNDSNAYTEVCSNFMTVSQMPPNSSCPQMDEKLKELTGIQQLVQNFSTEDIIPFDQDDECCSNSVVDGLDKLLSDDDIEDDIENLGSVITDQPIYADVPAKKSQEDQMIPMETPHANEYNLFQMVDPQQNQAISPKMNLSNSVLSDYSGIDGLSIPKNQDSNQWERTEKFCDNSSNVISGPEMLESLVANQFQNDSTNIRVSMFLTNLCSLQK